MISFRLSLRESSVPFHVSTIRIMAAAAGPRNKFILWYYTAGPDCLSCQTLRNIVEISPIELLIKVLF